MVFKEDQQLVNYFSLLVVNQLNLRYKNILYFKLLFLKKIIK